MEVSYDIIIIIIKLLPRYNLYTDLANYYCEKFNRLSRSIEFAQASISALGSGISSKVEDSFGLTTRSIIHRISNRFIKRTISNLNNSW